ncbi:hypothetical protein BKA62DRAFT_722215 [Auriculariales sp. MPI-PUGE-AT-0066]|nr:hypothetical protein BKA62DRAFT_722215 [Auriculariales sp. MPI-PUGE-AT-0066]
MIRANVRSLFTPSAQVTTTTTIRATHTGARGHATLKSPVIQELQRLRGRTGHNLSERHVRLAKSILYKSGYAKRGQRTEPSALSKDPAPAVAAARGEPLLSSTTDHVVPPPMPLEPGSEECCMSNCAVCVHDLYAEALTEWKEKYGHLVTTPTKVKMNVSLDAFAALEAELAAKRTTTA